MLGPFHGLPLIERDRVSKIVQHPNLPPQSNFQILEPLGLPVRVATGFHHCLMRVTNRVDIFIQALAQHFRFACFYRVIGKTQQDFRNGDIGLRSVDGIRESTQLVSFFLETLEAFVVLTLEGSGAHCTGAYSNNKQHQQKRLNSAHGSLSVSPLQPAVKRLGPFARLKGPGIV